VIALVLLASSVPALAQDGLTTSASVGTDGQQGDKPSRFPDVSANGRVVAFSGEASNLVVGDTNGLDDVFVHDRVSGLTERISVSSQGAQANARCRYPALSDNGRWVAFVSLADTLAPGVPAKGTVNIYLRDRTTSTTTLLSANAAGQSGDEYSTWPRISADGLFVAFISRAENLVPGDTDDIVDIYLRDVAAGALSVVSIGSGGQKADGSCHQPDISADGRRVAFASLAKNLVAGDTNDFEDVFVHDRVSGVTTRVSVSSAGDQADGRSVKPTLSADGRFVAFTSEATNLVAGDGNGQPDVFVHDLKTWTTTRASLSSSGLEGDGPTGFADISHDGLFVAFTSEATNLVAGDVNGVGDIFRHDRQSGATILLSRGSLGEAGNGNSVWPRLSGDGSVGVMESYATTLFPGDANAKGDALVRDLSPCPLPGRFCTPKQNSQGCLPHLDYQGTATLTGADDFHLVATDVLNRHVGMLIWGPGGQAVPFGGGTLCVVSPRRTPPLFSGGSPPPVTDCSGSFDFFVSHAFLGAAGLGPGSVVYAQFWSRDTGLPPPQNVGLTGGMHFLVCP